MDYKISIVRYLYYFSLTGLLILYLFPGSLIGYFFFGDFDRQPDMIPNPMGTSINHSLAFFYLTILGLTSYLNQTSFKKKNNFSFSDIAIFRIIPSVYTKQVFPVLRSFCKFNWNIISYCYNIFI